MAIIRGTSRNDTLRGGNADDRIFGLLGRDLLEGNGGNDRLDGGGGVDTMRGGAGNDTYIVDDPNDIVRETANSGNDQVQASVSFTLPNHFETLILLGAGNLNANGNRLSNIIFGTAGNNRLFGSGGNDYLYGLDGNDNLQGGNAFDTLEGGNGNDFLDGNLGRDTLLGGAGNDFLNGGEGNDLMDGGAGNDSYTIDSPADRIIETANNGVDLASTLISYNFSPDTEIEFIFLLGNSNLAVTGSDTDNSMVGNGGANFLDGRGGNDVISGGDGSDTLLGGTGNDVLDGGTGADSMVGGVGDDSYIVENPADIIVENANEGTDTVTASFAYTLTDNIENLILTGVGNFSGTGNAVSNSIFGNSGNNALFGEEGNDYLDGGFGNDTLNGGAGNDTFIVDSQGDVVFENFDDGIDTVQTTLVSYTLTANVENLTLLGTGNSSGLGNNLNNIITGNSGSNILFGDAGNDSIIGGEGNDTLNGGVGDDTLVGGLGNDFYIVTEAGDIVTEDIGGGIDTVSTNLSYTLTNNIENLTLTGNANLSGTGNSLNNTITGNDGNNILNGAVGNDSLLGGAGDDSLIGGAGIDTMLGGVGNDSYDVQDSADVVIEVAGQGIDQVNSSVTFNLATNGQQVENLVLTGSANINGTGNELSNLITGNSGNNTLLGGAGNDTLDGGAGADAMQGGSGNDSYIFDNVNDSARENLGDGNDTVVVAFTGTTGTFTIGDNIENLTLTGTNNINGIGNDIANRLIGNDGNNVLEGRGGNDVITGGLGNDTLNGGAGDDQLNGEAGTNQLIGGTGNDTYFVNTGDTIIENANEGIDTVFASETYTLSPNLENLTLVQGAGNINGTGNVSNNIITGNEGNNVLNGGGGQDQLIGGLGNDTYVIDSTDDAIVELPGGGTELVISTAQNYTLGANLENLTLDGTGNINGTGNDGANIILGNAGNNVIDGGSGDDILDGAAGNDRLIGGAGIDQLVGGTGNDTYVLSDLADTIAETGGDTGDTIEASIDFDLSLPAYVDIENLVLTGNALLGTGNASANLIQGNALGNTLSGGLGDDTLEGGGGGDRLIGGAGADSLVGGAGNDTFVIDANDTIVEIDGGGIDTVEANFDFVLTANLENLTLLDPALLGTGNEVDNIIIGNALNNELRGEAGNDRLEGRDGDDRLIGGSGIDTMLGGNGNDTYSVTEDGDEVLEESDTGGIDTVESSIQSFTLTDNLEVLILLGAAIIGIGSDGDNTILGNGNNNELRGQGGNDTIEGGDGNDLLDGGLGADTLSGSNGNDTYLVDDLADDVIELAASTGVDLVESSVDFDMSLPNRTGLDNLTLTGLAVVGTGNANANIILGNSQDNVLDGGGGSDRLEGNEGNDRLIGGAADAAVDTLLGGNGDDTYVVGDGDIVTEEPGAGTDTVEAAFTYTLGNNLENLVLIEGAGPINGTGNELDNLIQGNSDANVLRGLVGNDTLEGGGGNDSLDGGEGSDTMTGGDGNDTYVVDVETDVISETNATAAGGIDLVQSAVTWTLGANLEDLTLTGNLDINGTGNALVNTITGNAGNNELRGEDGTDILIGGAGNDLLDGGLQADNMTGGAGNDTFRVDNAGDIVNEADNGGTDLVESTIDFDLSLPGREFIENLTLFGTAITGTGNALNNIIIGNDEDNVLLGLAGNDVLEGGLGADRLDGGTGNDTLIGGEDDDTYVIDSAADVITELGTSTGDLVESFIDIDLSLPAFNGVDNLTLLGTAVTGIGTDADNIITGNDQNNVLEGRGGNDQLFGLLGNDLLDGGEGNDTMDGGLGNDTYVVDNTNDVVSETEVAGGIDTVRSSAPSLALGDNIENLILIPGTGAIEGIGNNIANTITGNENGNRLEGLNGNDTLIGGAGVDTMLGGLGSDTYFVDNSADVVTDNPGEGTADQIETTASYTLAGNSEIEVLILRAGAGNIDGIGNGFVNNIIGNEGNNLLDGGVGADRMEGGIGNDTYVVSEAGDVVVEGVGPGGGTDLIRSAISFDLTSANGNNIENLTLLEGAPDALNAVGNNLRNVITGNSLNNFLTGGGNDDTLIGGAGDDTYLVNDENDIITEALDAGIDTVRSQATLTLRANLENLILEPGFGAINGNGNELDNIIIGNESINVLGGGDGNDSLDGGLGRDVFSGGLGDDTFVVDDAAEQITEAAGEGIDEVQSSVSYTLGANLETLVLTELGPDININGTGNNDANLIIGNSGNNRIDGRGGTDTMQGGAGNDTYLVDVSSDVIEELADEGTDDVISLVNYTLSDFLENLTLTGATGNEPLIGIGNDRRNTITGNNGNNILEGLGGIDVLIGGGGNDRLDGGDGDDTMIGGTGNDTYIVNSDDELLTELANEGIDQVISSVSFTLGANLENLTLTGITGTEDINGTGNILNNVIIGNDGNNILDGGVDLATGAADGRDTLQGGLGDDTYVISGPNEDTIIEAADQGVDTVQSLGTFELSANLENLILLGIGNFNGFGNSEDNLIQGNDGNNLLNGRGGADQMIGGNGNDTYYVDNASDGVIEIGTGNDTVVSTISFDLSVAILASIENLSLDGTGNINGTGNASANVLNGNSGNNILRGREQNDTLFGGEGNDTLEGGANTATALGANDGNDTMDGGLGDDVLNGGVGNDTLTGGLGADSFLFDSQRDFQTTDVGLDTITDFEAGVDKILLDQTTFRAILGDTANNQLLSSEFAKVAADAAVATSSAFIVYSTESNRIFYNADGAGAGLGVAFAVMQGNPDITINSFAIRG